MRHQKLNIADWQQSPPPPAPNPTTRTREWLPDFRVAGLLGTLFLHALVFQSILLGSRAHTMRPPETQGLSATSMKTDAPPSETLILVDIPSAAMSDRALLEELASLGPKPSNTLITLLSPDPLPDIDIPKDPNDEDADSQAAVDSGDPAARAAMFGRYTGQIDGRIERIWKRPRSPVNPVAPSSGNSGRTSPGDEFKCQVRVIQDTQGRIQEVQMLSCNGSAAWQRSLVTAIFSASPLPAPPIPAVFTKSITMTFSASNYRPGSVLDGYESESSVPLRVVDREPNAVPRTISSSRSDLPSEEVSPTK